ncbi:hypothetical protein BDV19DRAFT_363983 [Aspergillus venezuelensis]
MARQQDLKRRARRRRVRLDSYRYSPDYEPRFKVSCSIDQDHIIMAGKRRESKRPPQFINGEPDIRMLDDHKQSSKKAKPITPANDERAEATPCVLIPSTEAQFDSDVSSLTELEDLPEDLSESITDIERDKTDHDVNPKTAEPEIQGHRNTTAPSELAGPGECVACAGKIINLRQQTQQLLLSKSRDIRTLEEEIDYLKEEVAELRTARAASNTSTFSKSRTSLIQLRDSQAEVKRLRLRLYSAQEFGVLIRPLPQCDDPLVESTRFINREMDTLSNYVAYTADLLCNIRHQGTAVGHSQVLEKDLVELVAPALASTDLLSFDPMSAFRALLFRFIQTRVFEDPAIWRDLHFDGTMVRQYQQIVEQSISPNALERYHRAALHLTLSESGEFQEIFVDGYTKQLEFELVRLITPFIRVEDIKRHLKRELHQLLVHALQLRAKCYPHKGTRYRLIQFPPGQVYDARFMRAEDNVGTPIRVPHDGQVRRIKVCMHGLMKAHSVRETASGVDLIDELSQPFLLNSDTEGHLISDKATVLLE